ncbi:MAG: integrin alpha [Clostridiales bacterium]
MKSLRTLPFVFYFISLFSLKVYSASSDSLYLVRTFHGDSFENGALNKWGGLGDINHDGKDDFVISYSSDYWGDKHHSGYAELYLGCDDLVNIKPSYVFKNCDFINPIGDVNNDGFDDFLVAEFDSAYSPYLMDKFKVYFGNNQMFDTIPKFTFRPSYGWMIYFIYTEKLGDINGDGYDDFAISTPYNWSNGYGKVYIFLGGKTLDEKPALILEDPFKSDKVHNNFGDGVTGI